MGANTERKYIDLEAAKKEVGRFAGYLDEDMILRLQIAIERISESDVVSRDEGIKMGAELAAMHGATPEQQQLEEAYFKGVEYGMTRRDVRPVVRGKWVDYARRGIYGMLYACSECGAKYTGKSPFCPNCGADMRMGAE